MNQAVTCVIPTHGRDHLLQQALESVLAQTRPAAEIIIVDDMGSASTHNVVSKFSFISPPRLRYVDASQLRIKNAGASRNIGASAASTDTLAFLDDDDWWEPTFLEKMTAAASVSPSGWAITWCSFVKNSYVGDGHTMPISVHDADVFARNPGMTGSNFMIERGVFDAVGGFDQALRVSNDRDLLIRLLRNNHTYNLVPERLCMQRSHDQGQLTTRTESRAKGLESFIAKYDDDLTKRDRRYLMREIHSVRRISSASRRSRLYHTGAQLLTYSPAELLSTIKRKHNRPTMY